MASKREEIGDPGSWLNQAGDDEQVWILVERDPAAVFALRAWMEARVSLGLSKKGDAAIRAAEWWIDSALRRRRAGAP